jgi:CRISPR-associated endonuclease Csn1
MDLRRAGVKIDYRLSLDLGTNSIGWCIYRLDRDDTGADDRERWRPVGIQRIGVRIFSDGRNPKDLASLAMARRLARQQRRRRDRALKRKAKFLKALVATGLLPDDPEKRKQLVSLDPYALRARALTEALNPHHVGRALFHLARKRGFRSGRKDLAVEEKEAGKIKMDIPPKRSHRSGTWEASVPDDGKPVAATG